MPTGAGQGAYIFAPAGPVVSKDEAAFFADAQPWGFILFSRNVESPDQLKSLCAALRDAVGRNAPILIDQEGGRVQRMGPPLWRDWPAPLDQADMAGDNADRSFWLRARLIAHDLTSVGIDVNCVPTCDIARTDTHPVLRNRCYGTDRDSVISRARATTLGLAAGGVLPVMKHMPGHGRATVDSHLDLPQVSDPLEVLDDTDFAVFRALNDLPMGMSAHLVFSAVSTRPATIDPTLIDLIRTRIGFEGLLMTDDISMEALSGTVATRAEASLGAGCDLVLHCNGVLPEMQAIARAAGAMSPAAQARADSALGRRSPPQAIDIPALEAEFEQILATRAG